MPDNNQNNQNGQNPYAGYKRNRGIDKLDNAARRTSSQIKRDYESKTEIRGVHGKLKEDNTYKNVYRDLKGSSKAERDAYARALQGVDETTYQQTSTKYSSKTGDTIIGKQSDNTTLLPKDTRSIYTNQTNQTNADNFSQSTAKSVKVAGTLANSSRSAQETPPTQGPATGSKIMKNPEEISKYIAGVSTNGERVDSSITGLKTSNVESTTLAPTISLTDTQGNEMLMNVGDSAMLSNGVILEYNVNENGEGVLLSNYLNNSAIATKANKIQGTDTN